MASQLEVEEWRRRQALPADHPEAMTIDDYRKVVAHMREDRTAAQAASKASKERAAKPKVDIKELLKNW